MQIFWSLSKKNFTLPLLFFSFFVHAAEVKPTDSFVTIDSPHFEVIINAKQQALGQYYAQKLETSFGLLKEFFSTLPEKTIVIINDKTDVTNGYATRIPYSHIMIFPVLPGPTESLGEFGDWNLELLSHEYTHVLNFEPALGVMSYIRPVFGSIVAPNLLLPNWWKEGLAVHIETAIGSKGRLRSIYQDSILRSFVLKENLMDFNIAEINEVIPTWPEGMRSYIFGSLAWSQMTAEKGSRIADDLNQRHARRVPYFIETPAKEHLGLSYEDLYDVTLHWVQDKALEQIFTLRTLKPTPTQKFPTGTQTSGGATISPNGKFLAMITVSDTDRRLVKIYERQPGANFLSAKPWGAVETLSEPTAPTKLLDGPPTGSIQRISWFPDSARIIYDRIDAVNSTETFSDLHIYNLTTDKTTQLTRALRAREPAVSPSGNLIAFIKLSAAKTSLAVLNMQTKKYEIIRHSQIGERFSIPVFLDESRLLISSRNSEGQEHLFMVDLKSKSWQPVLAKYPDSRFPLVTANEVYFTSSWNGTHNIYVTSKDFREARPVSHTLTSLMAPAYDPEKKDLYATEITVDGPAVVLLEKKDQVAPKTSLPVIHPLAAERYPVKLKPAAAAQPENFPVSEYSSASHLWPHYWIPFFASSTSSNGVVIQAMTSGFDPLKKNMYQLAASWDSAVNKGSFEGTYINNMTSNSYLLQAYQTSTYLVSGSNPLTNSGAVVGISPDLWSFNRYTTGMLSWRYLNTEFSSNSKIKRTGPALSLSYSNFSMSGTEISPETGTSAYLSAVNYIESRGYVGHSQFFGGGNYYFSKWLPARHALALKLNGVYTPQKISSILGVSTTSLMPYQDSINPSYVMRGYLNGQFLGRTLVNTNIEYRFPIRDVYYGSGTNPIFLRRLHGAFVVDGVALDGHAYNPSYEDPTIDPFDPVVITNRSFWSVGAEVRLETTVGYVLPLTFVLGLYNPVGGMYGSGAQLGMTLQLGGGL